MVIKNFKECVECYGNLTSLSDYTLFYHGINKEIMFHESIDKNYGPLSTSNKYSRNIQLLEIMLIIVIMKV